MSEENLVGTIRFKRRPSIEEAPTSCRCGGDTAFVACTGALTTMLGCVCHHEISVKEVSTGLWEVTTYYKKDVSP